MFHESLSLLAPCKYASVATYVKYMRARERAQQLSLGLVAVPVTSLLCVATINLACPNLSRVITLRRLTGDRSSVILRLTNRLPPFFSAGTRQRLFLIARRSHCTCPGGYYRDGKQKLRPDISLNHKNASEF